MLECSGAASAVNADGMCCKDDLSIAFSFICVFVFFYSCLWNTAFDFELN